MIGDAGSQALTGGLGLLGLGAFTEGGTYGSVSASSIGAPARYLRDMENARGRIDEEAGFSRGMHNWHSLSFSNMVAGGGITELPWIFIGGVYHELDPIAIVQEAKGQGAWLFVDLPLDLIANPMGMIGGLILPTSVHGKYAECVGAMLPLPPDGGSQTGGESHSDSEDH